jgi:hypothetical protein
MDVLTDVNTPDNSDVEGDEVDEPLFLGVRQVLLQVEAIPTRPEYNFNLKVKKQNRFNTRLLSVIHPSSLFACANKTMRC